jgi:AraC-like DNA-binding protein
MLADHDSTCQNAEQVVVRPEVGMAGPKVQYPKLEEAARKHKRAIELKRAGWSLDDIAAEVGYANRSGVTRAIKAAMERSRSEMFVSAELYRAESLERLEALLKACWQPAMNGSKDHIAEARRIVSDIGDLTGAKAPIRIEVGESDIDRLLAGLESELGRRAAAIEGEVVPSSGIAVGAGKQDD